MAIRNGQAYRQESTAASPRPGRPDGTPHEQSEGPEKMRRATASPQLPLMTISVPNPGDPGTARLAQGAKGE